MADKSSGREGNIQAATFAYCLHCLQLVKDNGFRRSWILVMIANNLESVVHTFLQNACVLLCAFVSVVSCSCVLVRARYGLHGQLCIPKTLESNIRGAKTLIELKSFYPAAKHWRGIGRGDYNTNTGGSDLFPARTLCQDPSISLHI